MTEDCYAEVAPISKEKFNLKGNDCYDTSQHALSSYVGPAGKKALKNNSCSTALKCTLVLILSLLLIALLASSAVAWLEILKLKSNASTMQAMISENMLGASFEAVNDSGIEDEYIVYLNNSIDLLNQKITHLQNNNMNIENITQLITSGLATFPANSCADVLHLSPSAPSDFYWTRSSSDGSPLRVYCDMQLIRSLETFPANSCADIHTFAPSAPSGYYWISSSNGSTVHVYCDMTRSCGGVTGGWMRAAKLDMTDCSNHCPNSLRPQTYSNKRTCVVDPGSSQHCACSSVTYPSNAVNYSRVCGRVRGYQFASPDAFYYASHSCPRDSDSAYVDGITLTHGRSPRKHIWTFAAGSSEVLTDFGICPCISSSARQPPEFVGDDYFCDTGNKGGSDFEWRGHFFIDDPLWDGIGCENSINQMCCSHNNPPWFHKQLPQPTTDDIEMRVCRDQLPAPDDENVGIEIVEIYVQ